MFHVERVLDAARYSGLKLETSQVERLQAFRDWLAGEAHRAGGIGPGESGRLERRHIADSLLFASRFDHDTTEIWDLGTGVGLPGIPLAIALPRTRVVLIDRSGKRIDLVKRAVRILGLENCQPRQAEIASLDGVSPVIVSRASLPPAQLATHIGRHLRADGVAVIGGSWETEPHHEDWETVEIPAEVLDQRVWLLIMRRA